MRSLSTGAGAKPPPAPGPSFPPGTSAAAQAPKQALPAAPASIAPARGGPAVAGTPQSAPQLPQPPQKAGGSVGNGLAFAAVVAAVAGAGYVAVECVLGKNICFCVESANIFWNIRSLSRCLSGDRIY